MLLFCDLDWTLADNSHRIRTLDGEYFVPGVSRLYEWSEVDWDWHNDINNIIEDKLISVRSIDVLNYWKLEKNCEIVYVSSRQEKERFATAMWLWKYSFPYGFLYCVTLNDADALSDKGQVLEMYADRIKQEGALFYDDDVVKTLEQHCVRFNVELRKPRYVYGEAGFWEEEYNKIKCQT